MTPHQFRVLTTRNEFERFRPAYVEAAEKLHQISHQIDASYRGIYDQMERMNAQIRAYRDLIPPVPDFSKLMGFTHANENWEQLINQATASSKIVEDLSGVHPSWIHGLNPMHDIVGQLQAISKLSLIGVASRLAVSERYLARIDSFQLQIRLSFPELQLDLVYEPINGIIRAYETLADSITTYSELTRFPAFALPGATRELLTTCYALDEVSTVPSGKEQHDPEIGLVADIDAETSECERLLREIDPHLAELLRGAQDAFEGHNADRVRHVLSSLRELWNHVLRSLAPDHAVRSWTNKAQNFHDGKPTRRARVLYICRSLADAPLIDFVLQDASSLTTLFSIFNRVHELNPAFSDSQLRALLLRTRSALTYLLQICKE